MANVELTQAAIDDRMLRRDLDQAREAQSALMPPADPLGTAAGCVIPARQLSGISSIMSGLVTAWPSVRGCCRQGDHSWPVDGAQHRAVSPACQTGNGRRRDRHGHQ